MIKTLQNVGYMRCWDDEQLRQRAMQNMGNLFAGGDAVPEEPDWQLALDADNDLLLDEGGKDDEVSLDGRGACGFPSGAMRCSAYRMVTCAGTGHCHFALLLQQRSGRLMGRDTISIIEETTVTAADGTGLLSF